MALDACRLVDELRARGVDVRVSRTSALGPARWWQVEVATGDLTDPPAIEAAFKAVEKTSLVNAVKLTLRMTPRGRNYDLDDERQPYF